jgi:hypothetical protein
MKCLRHREASLSAFTLQIEFKQNKHIVSCINAAYAAFALIMSLFSGGHQMIAGFTAPYNFQRDPNVVYYNFNWGREGSVLVTSFGVKIVASGNSVEFVEGLANYATFMCTWSPYQSNDPKEQNYTCICLDDYKSVDANTGEQTPVSTCAKKFIVDNLGAFVRVLNSDELVNEAIELAVQAAVAPPQAQNNHNQAHNNSIESKSAAQKSELKSLLMAQRDVMVKGVVDDVALMWRCWVQVWTHEVQDKSSEEVIYGHRCAKRKRVIGSNAEDNKKTLEKFYDEVSLNSSVVSFTNYKHEAQQY